MIAVDLGQSGCRIKYGDQLHTTQLAKLAGKPISEALERNFQQITAQSDLVALSLTGLYGDVGDVAPFLEICRKHFGAKEVVVIDDGLANFAGSLLGQSGVALTLGGGVVAVGGHQERFSHSDGLGNIFGDEGGGIWLGGAGLTRALATRDLRDNDKEILEHLGDEVAIFDSLESKNGTEAVSLAIVAARKVLELAESGNRTAVAIRDLGALRLSKTVISAWLKVGDISESFKVTVSGGISQNAAYKKLIFEKIKEAGASAELVDIRGDNIDGAIWLAENIKHDIRPMLGWAR